MALVNVIKNELTLLWQKKTCCRFCETYGMLLFLKKDDNIVFNTSSEESARHLRSLLRKTAEIFVDIENVSPTKYRIEIPVADLSEKFDFSFDESAFSCDNCKIAFIRGAFLASGQCSDPKKEYHIEFISTDEELSYALCKMLIEFGFDAKTCAKQLKNSTRYIVYLKNSTDIEDLLTLMGAQNCAMDLMEVKIMKDVRNNINRRTNFETANIKKSSVSCAKQLEAINKLESMGKLTTLPEDLYELAVARRENIDMSLSELGAKFGLSRSGVHHRLQKLIELSQKE